MLDMDRYLIQRTDLSDPNSQVGVYRKGAGFGYWGLERLCATVEEARVYVLLHGELALDTTKRVWPSDDDYDD